MALYFVKQPGAENRSTLFTITKYVILGLLFSSTVLSVCTLFFVHPIVSASSNDAQEINDMKKLFYVFIVIDIIVNLIAACGVMIENYCFIVVIGINFILGGLIGLFNGISLVIGILNVVCCLSIGILALCFSVILMKVEEEIPVNV